MEEIAANDRALDWVIFKIAQRCNINCSYCYVYNMGDDSWKSRPKFVSDEIVHSLGVRIAEQCERYKLPIFNIEFHGGEPLLIGIRRFREVVGILNGYATNYRIKYHLQTNGILLSEPWLEAFAELGVSFGISFDGPPEIADVFRIDHQGRGTTNRVSKNIRSYGGSANFKATFGGVLCVVMNPDIDERKLIDWFVMHDIGGIDFLLPDANYFSPLPPLYTPELYGKFLVRAFDYWVSLDANAPNIRLFDYIIRGLTGEVTGLDSLGGDLSLLCVVESDGSIGISDVGRICPPLRIDKLNILDHALNLHSEIYDIENLQKLSVTCASCKHLRSCRGGYLPHRFDGTSFQNPSYYCSALYEISEHIYRYLKTELSRIAS